MERLQEVCCVVMVGMCILFFSGAAHAADGLVETVTDDGIVLKMKRYRPTPEDCFNTGKQPILLFSGIVCNMNEFLAHTPEERADDYQGMALPQPPAPWAEGDDHIAEDPMLYYSIAYYLWHQGYDPWFANYRGTGRGEFKSQRGDIYTTLDVWAALDAPACIRKVYDITHIHPVIGGHSTGGLVSYCYLQGIYMDPAEMGNGYIPHVQSSIALAQQRNSEIKGFIGLDPAAIPPFPNIGPLDSLVYPVISIPLYLNIDGLMEYVVNPMLQNSGTLITVVDLVFGIISNMHDAYATYLGGCLPKDFDLFGYMNFWQVDNTHPYVEDYFARYGSSSTYLRGISQYMDFFMQSTIREHWMNGEENKNRIVVPDAAPGEDGYYYYRENMALMTVPAIVLLSYYDSLVASQEIIEDIMEAKTPSIYDEYYIVPDSSHVDVPVGLNAPTYSFPRVGAWLEKVIDASDAQDDTQDGSQTPAGEDSVRSSGSSGGGEDESGECFISIMMQSVSCP